MYVLKSRWLALVAICLLIVPLAGCQIDSSTGTIGDLRYVKIAPDLNLHAAPDGFVYELWALGIDFNFEDSILVPTQVGPFPVARFQWDPYLYAATDENGAFLPLTLGDGMEMDTDVDINAVFATINPVAFLTVEPIDEPPAMREIPNGPILLAFNLNAESHRAVLLNSFALLQLFGVGNPIASYSLLSQSNKKGVTNAIWRDNETEGNGIWFANPHLEVSTVLDSINAWNAYSQTIAPANDDPFVYTVWIHRVHPESSFSNFGLVLENREPDFESLDGFPVHAPGRYGPSETIFRLPPQPSLPGVQLGSDPYLIDGQVVGYRYIVTNATGGRDTCIVRVDDPSLTHCNRDTFPVLTFDDESLLPRAYRFSTGDTTMGPTLAGLLDLSDIERLNEVTFGNAFIFLGWEYEAWLVFTKGSGIPPMSLGRFKGPRGFDSNNPYTYTDGRYDQNFDLPGEDFLHDLPNGLSSPLNVITNADVEKLWITIEPDDDFGYDWAPDKPNTQLIYLSAFLPKFLPLDTSSTPRVAQFPMVHRDLNPGPNGLNEGNFFPTVTVQFLPAPTE